MRNEIMVDSVNISKHLFKDYSPNFPHFVIPPSDCVRLRKPENKCPNSSIKPSSNPDKTSCERYRNESSFTSTSQIYSVISSIPSFNQIACGEGLSRRKNVRFSEKLESKCFFQSAEWSGGNGSRSISARFLPKFKFLRKQPQKSVDSSMDSCIGCLPWHRSIDPIQEAVWTSGAHLRHTVSLDSKSIGLFKRFLNEKPKNQNYSSMFSKYIDTLTSKSTCSTTCSYDLNLAMSMTGNQMESFYVSELDLTDDEGYSESCSDWEGYERPSCLSSEKSIDGNNLYEPVKRDGFSIQPYNVKDSQNEVLKPKTEIKKMHFPKLHEAQKAEVCLQNVRHAGECNTTKINSPSESICQPLKSSRENQIAFSLNRLTLPTWVSDRFCKSDKGYQKTIAKEHKPNIFLPRFPRYLIDSEDSFSNDISVEQIQLVQQP